MATSALHCTWALQRWAPLHALSSSSPHIVPSASGVWLTPARTSHWSTVQGLLSSMSAGTRSTWATPCTGSQLSTVQLFPSSISIGTPLAQTPAASHVSSPLQESPSEQLVPAATGVCVTPFVASQASTVHGLPSSTGVDEQSPPPVPTAVTMSAAISAWDSGRE